MRSGNAWNKIITISATKFENSHYFQRQFPILRDCLKLPWHDTWKIPCFCIMLQTNIYLLSFGTKSHIADTLNHLHSLQGTQDAHYFQLTFYGPISKLSLHPSGPEINTKSTITSVFFYKSVDTGRKTITFGNRQNHTWPWKDKIWTSFQLQHHSKTFSKLSFANTHSIFIA